MSEVVTFENFTPPPRFDSVAWTDVQIEEALTKTGTYVIIDTVALSPVDADPTDPATRNFTTPNGTAPDLWYRVVFLDGVGGETVPTVPLRNSVAGSGTAILTTVASLKLGVRQKARMEDSDDDNGLILSWVNRAYFDAAIETNFYKNGDVTAALEENDVSVELPNGIVKIEFIVPTGTDGGVWGPMEEVGFDWLLAKRANAGGTQNVGAPSHFAFRSSGAPFIDFWPDASGGEVLTFYGMMLPDALEEDTDRPIFPDPYAANVIEYGALTHAAEFKRDSEMLSYYSGLYLQWVRKLRAFNNNRAGAQTRQMVVAGFRGVPHRNDTDTGD